jgi:hypothetical protein
MVAACASWALKVHPAGCCSTSRSTKRPRRDPPVERAIGWVSCSRRWPPRHLDFILPVLGHHGDVYVRVSPVHGATARESLPGTAARILEWLMRRRSCPCTNSSPTGSRPSLDDTAAHVDLLEARIVSTHSPLDVDSRLVEHVHLLLDREVPLLRQNILPHLTRDSSSSVRYLIFWPLASNA